MPPRCLLLVTFLCAAVVAQEPAVPAPTEPTQKAPATEALRRAFVDAAADRTAIHTAASHVNKSGPEGKARFMATLHAVAAVAPKPVDAPPSPPAGADAPKPTEFADDVRALMADVATGTAEQCNAAIRKLVDMKEAGAPALARLHERGTAILQRCILLFVRAKVATNALYAGQFDELRDFRPEACTILLGWAKTAPREAAAAPTFRGACIRALRDLVPDGGATDAMRNDLHAIVLQAQQANDESLYVTAACALHQFGDASVFDAIKTQVDKHAAADNDEHKLAATSTLADLHYQLRKYGEAAGYFSTTVALLEKLGRPPENIMTPCYNAACSLALAGKTDEAFAYLEKALQFGAKGRQLGKAMLDEDRDITSLRPDPRFRKLIDQYFGTGSRSAK